MTRLQSFTRRAAEYRHRIGIPYRWLLARLKLWLFPYDLLVVSAGGCATTEFIKALRQTGLRTNDEGDWDGIKHMYPSRFLKAPVVYIHGDPLLAAMSLFRRDYHSRQAFKLRWHLLPYRTTLAEYAAEGEEYLGLIRHLDAWMAQAAAARTDMLFINVDDLDRIGEDTWQAFIGRRVSIDFRVRGRSSSRDKLAPEDRTALERMYRGYDEARDALRHTLWMGGVRKPFELAPVVPPKAARVDREPTTPARAAAAPKAGRGVR